MASPAIRPEANSVPLSSMITFCSALRPRGDAIENPLDHAADENRRGRTERQIHSDGDQHRRASAAQQQSDSKGCSDPEQSPSHLAADDSFGQLGHQSRLRRGQSTAADAAGSEIGLMQRDNRPH